MAEKIIPRRGISQSSETGADDKVKESAPEQEPEVKEDKAVDTKEEHSIVTKEVLEIVNFAEEKASLVKTEAGHMLGKIEEQEKNAVKVIVTVPKAFRLTLDHSTVINIPAGVQKVAKFIADHWYSKVNGMKIFEE